MYKKSGKKPRISMGGCSFFSDSLRQQAEAVSKGNNFFTAKCAMD
jgi:hypothetical protein